MSAGRGNLERAPGKQLAAHIGQIPFSGRRNRRGMRRGGREPGLIRPIQRLDGFGQRAHETDLDAFDDARFGRILRRQQQASESQPPRRDGNRQHAANRVDRAVQRQFADDHGVVNRLAGQWAGRGEQAQRDRQVERRPGLPHVGRREVDGDAMVGEVEAGVANRGSDAVPALAHGRIGQPDHGEVGEPERNVDLDVDRIRLDPEHRGAAKAGQHGHPVLQGAAPVGLGAYTFNWRELLRGRRRAH